MRRRFYFAILLAVPLASKGQALLPADAAAKLNQAMNSSVEGDPLPCSAEPMKPFLDFAFRFQSGYILRCPWREFGGRAETIATYVRISPDQGTPLLLGDRFEVPEIAAESLKRIDLNRFKEDFEISGGFTLGEGEYAVDLLAVDQHNRIFRKSWRAKASRSRDERNIPLSIAPQVAEPFSVRLFPGAASPPTTHGVRLTILVDAAPMNPRSPRLRVWDRALLLDCLSSLVHHTPYESIRVIAFNLDQQREVFRQESLDAPGFAKLSAALRDLNLGTVAYRTVNNEFGWSALLSSLVTEELNRPQPSDAVIFLGPTSRLDDKIPDTLTKLRNPNRPPFFYFEYVPPWRNGREFPDVLERLNASLDGKTFKIHDPGQLDKAIRKMQSELKMGDEKAQASDVSPAANIP